MKFKIALFLAAIFAASTCSAIECRIEDGVRKYPIATINGWTCWTKKELDETLARKSTFTVTVVYIDQSQKQDDVNLSTCPISATDEEIQTMKVKKDLVLEKMAKLKVEMSGYAGHEDSDVYADLKQRYDWLDCYYQAGQSGK